MSEGNIPTKYENLESFSCLEVKINERGFEDGMRRFKSLIQKSQILSLYKERQYYEKPSERKRRKRREAKERRRITEYREKLIASGEWDKRQKRKEQKRKEKLEKKNKVDYE